MKILDENVGALRGCRVYLVGHMEYADGQDWRNRVIKELAPLGVKVFNPYNKPFCGSIDEGVNIREELHAKMQSGDFDYVSSYMRQVRNDDLRLCDIADFFIVNISPKIASWGSAEELCTANREKKTIYLIVEGGKQNTPLWVMGMIPHENIFGDVESIIAHLKKVNENKVPLDKRWKVLKPEYR